MRKWLIVLGLIFFMYGCGKAEFGGCDSAPAFFVSGTVKEVIYVGEGGLLGGNTNTAIYFTDGRSIILGGSFHILYSNIIIYKTCILNGSYIIKKGEVNEKNY